MKMSHMKKILAATGFILLSGLINTTALAQQKNDPKFNKLMQDSFRAEGIAGLDRIVQDETQKFCSDPVFSNSKQGAAMREKIQKINMATIKQPADGKYIGDWKKGKQLLKVVAVQLGLIRLTLLLAVDATTATKLILKKFPMEILAPLSQAMENYAVTRKRS